MRDGSEGSVGMGCPTIPGMRTRLTDILEIEHPVMLAGMGGVSYSAARGGGQRGRRLRLPGRVDHGPRQDGRARSPPSATLTDKPFGVDLLTAAPGDMETQVEAIIDGGGRGVRGRPRRAP